MKILELGAALVAASLVLAGPAGAVDIKGAGATFPAPLYKSWIEAYNAVEPGVSISYDAIGSGGGIKRFIDQQVDFGASDAAMTDAQIAAVEQGAVLVPATAGMVVIAYNMPDMEAQLRLSRSTLTRIFLGEITRWDDPRIEADNPGVDLPNRSIAVVVRRDSSGTTFAISNHLAAVDSGWESVGPGVGTTLDWPGAAMTAVGNDGVAGRLAISQYSLGYVEYGYARRAGLSMAILQNRDGQFVAPDEASGAAALDAAVGQMPANGRQFIPDPLGAQSYPIVTYSWLLLYGTYAETAMKDALAGFITWGLDQGQTQAEGLGYIPLPPSVVAKSKALLAEVQ
ncbi:MAG: phosphate ABC transporter substrate-binding protein PstS [Pseudomonadota bacterium]